MPPVRTASTPSIAASAIKPMKTERTHEENQERAYIAASRRSDRSLEARVESARRASEIHKRRTGRSLRVTEQDVINEEMYEEEDDDLPNQYRRLTAHLHTSNAEFDRRLAAYLTNHVAMRTALGQAGGMPNGAYPNAPSFANMNNNFMSAFPQPSAQMGPPMQPAHNFSASPAQTFISPAHQRSASIANPTDVPRPRSNVASADSKSRRMSLPQSPPNKRLKSIHNLKLDNLPKMELHSPSSSDASTPQTLRPSEFPAPFHMSSFDASSVPFSTALPLASQQLLSGAFDYNDPMTAMLMPNSGYPHQHQPMKGSPGWHNAGMDQTLAPGYLENDSLDPAVFNATSPYATDTFGAGFEDYSRQPPLFPSGQATPNDREWASFIDGNAWDDGQTN